MNKRAEPKTIYVKLVNEDIDVWRPVKAFEIDNSSYQISDMETVPDSEVWEFSPGAIVGVRIELNDGERILKAYKNIVT